MCIAACNASWANRVRRFVYVGSSLPGFSTSVAAVAVGIQGLTARAFGSRALMPATQMHMLHTRGYICAFSLDPPADTSREGFMLAAADSTRDEAPLCTVGMIAQKKRTPQGSDLWVLCCTRHCAFPVPLHATLRFLTYLSPLCQEKCYHFSILLRRYCRRPILHNLPSQGQRNTGTLADTPSMIGMRT